MQEYIEFKYKNWKGEISDRKVIPGKVYFGSTEFHPVPQLLMEGFDIDKQEQRTFALRDIIHPEDDIKKKTIDRNLLISPEYKKHFPDKDYYDNYMERFVWEIDTDD